MKTLISKSYLLFCLTVTSLVANSQINLAPKFKCARGGFFTDGKIQINSKNYFDDEKGFSDWFNKTSIKDKTSDGIYYSKIYKNKKHVYVFVMPNSKAIIMMVASVNDKYVQDFSKWLLAQIRLYIKDKMPIKIFNHKNATC